MKQLPLFFVVLLCFLVFWIGCANQGSGPDGGPYDETPPRIVGMTAPEKAGRSKKVKFSLTFNELIKVDNPSEKIIVSPPQTETPEIKVSGRKITVELLDSIHPNTTYTVDFSDAITDNNEGNPLGQYTYIFSTGANTDTMEMSGHVLNAEDLEPVKGILVGLHRNPADSAFTRYPFDRVARTDASGFFSIKGVASDTVYRIYALEDADGNFKYSQPAEAIGTLAERIRAGSYADVRYDTIWVDSTRYDSIRIIPYTHFTPDDIVIRSFKVVSQQRHFLKYKRDVPEWFTTFFTAPSQQLPTIKGLNFDEKKAFIVCPNATNDTITYWLADTTLLRQDTLRMAYTYDNWNDSLSTLQSKTDTLEIVPKITFAKRQATQLKELEKWKKQLEKRHKRNDFSDENPPVEFLECKSDVSGQLAPDHNILITVAQPLADFRKQGIRLQLKVDTLWKNARYELDSVPENIMALRLRAEWRPGQQYRLQIDSATFRSIYGKVNSRSEVSFEVARLEEFGTIFLDLVHADSTTIVQLLNADGSINVQVPARGGRAEIYYVKPGNYYIRCFFDRNRDGRWTTGSWQPRVPPEEVYYLPEELQVRANWDINRTWDVTALRLDRQKPEKLIKQKLQNRSSTSTHQRNIERLRKRGR